MPPTSLDSRLVEFEACFNFRDLGGYETRAGRSLAWGRLYRADALHRFTDADLETFAGLGLRTVIDLRASQEISRYGRLSTRVEGHTWHHEPIIDSLKLEPGQRALPAGEEDAPREPGEGYYMFFAEGQAATNVIGLIADSDGPSVFHCTAGKDRTGMIAAMILDLLGVPDETIVEDYHLTQLTRARSTAWIAENEPEYAAYLDEIPQERRRVQPEAILGFLSRLRDAHGSVAELVRERGLTQSQLDRLKQSLLT